MKVVSDMSENIFYTFDWIILMQFVILMYYHVHNNKSYIPTYFQSDLLKKGLICHESIHLSKAFFLTALTSEFMRLHNYKTRLPFLSQNMKWL